MKTFISLFASVLILAGSTPAQSTPAHVVVAQPSIFISRSVLKANTPAHFAILDFIQDESNYPVTVTAVGSAAFGTVALANGIVTYIPGPNFAGQDTFSYTITDTGNASDSSTFTISDFAFLAGNYALYADTGVEPQIVSNGGILTLTATGSFTFRCGSTSASGQFTEGGGFTKALFAGYPLPILGLSLTLQNSGPTLTGYYSYGSVHDPDIPSVSITGYKIAPAGANKGRYSVLFQPTSTSGPQGIGYATMNVTAAGRITYAGQFNDGQSFSAIAGVRADGTFPVVLSHTVTIPVATFAGSSSTYPFTLYSYYLQGSATFRDITGVSDFDGSVQYRKTGYDSTHPPATQTFPQGFNVALNMIGSRFTPAGPGKHLLQYSKPTGTASLTFTGGGLSAPVAGTATIAPGEIVKKVTAPVQSLIIYAADSPVFGSVGGLITGYFENSGVNARRSFNGVVFQKQNIAAGLFRGNTDTGSLTLTPQ